MTTRNDDGAVSPVREVGEICVEGPNVMLGYLNDPDGTARKLRNGVLYTGDIAGSYVSVEPFHLFRYLDEQVFRYNNRATKEHKVTDADRFNMAVRKIFGKRLTFAELTGKLYETEAF